MKNIIISSTMLLLLLFNPSEKLIAQEETYKVKVIKEVNGKTEVIEKSYSSKEEMERDSELGDIKILHLDSALQNKGYSFASDSSGTMKIFVTSSSDSQGNVFVTKDRVIKISAGEGGIVVMKGGEGDSIHSNRFTFQSTEGEVNKNMEFITEDGEVIHIQKRNGQEGTVFFWSEEDGSEIHTSDGHKVVVTRSSSSTRAISIQNATTNEIVDANFAASKVFQPQSIEYLVDTRAGKIDISMQAKASPISISIRNLEGTSVYDQNVDPFKGSYTGSIDISGQEKGTYILEIRQGQKALHKKIVVE